jgi:hypothetical protein
VPINRLIDSKAFAMQIGVSQKTIYRFDLVLFAGITAQVATKVRIPEPLERLFRNYLSSHSGNT